MKGLLFLTLFIVLAYIAFTFTTKEGFQSRLESEKGIVKVPLNVPAPTIVDVSSPAPYMPPADKEYGPAFGEVARVNTLPYRDPALETASYKRLEELRQSLAGFLAFEAKGLQDQGDPAIQLPLSTLRGDFQRITDEVSVLKRNPGLNSQLTLRDVQDIQSNLDYLQKKYRLFVNSVSYDGSAIEGFEDASGGDVSTADLASQKDVETAILRVKSEILRLSKSSTTDPVIKGRVAVLTRIQQKMEEIVRDLKAGTRTQDQIPILKKDLEEFLPLAGDPSKPITKFLDENNLPNTLENLFPAYEAGDISGAKLAGYLFDTYADTIVKGLSWNVGLKYTSPNEAAAGSSSKSGTSISGTGLTTGEDTTVNNLYSLFDGAGGAGTQENLVGPSSDFSSPASFSRGEFENYTNPSRNKSTEASQYDWKTKAGQICEAVRRQGLKPGDFGCLESSASVGADYSWRGNARMVCTRLQSSFNTALPELCGCPPMDWPGWRS